MSRLGILDASTQYRQGVLTALGNGGWAPDLERSAYDAMQRLARARQVTLTPNAGRAALAAARTILCIAVPLIAADRLWAVGWRWAAAPLVVVAAMAI